MLDNFNKIIIKKYLKNVLNTQNYGERWSCGNSVQWPEIPVSCRWRSFQHVSLAGSKPWRVVCAVPDIFHSPLACLFMQGNFGKAVPAASFCIAAWTASTWWLHIEMKFRRICSKEETHEIFPRTLERSTVKWGEKSPRNSPFQWMLPTLSSLVFLTVYCFLFFKNQLSAWRWNLWMWKISKICKCCYPEARGSSAWKWKATVWKPWILQMYCSSANWLYFK